MRGEPDCPSHRVAVSSSPAVDSAASVCYLTPGTDDLFSQPGYVALHSASAVDCCLTCITRRTQTHINSNHSNCASTVDCLLFTWMFKTFSSSFFVHTTGLFYHIQCSWTYWYLAEDCSSLSTSWRHSSRNFCTSSSCLLTMVSNSLFDSTALHNDIIIKCSTNSNN